MPSTSTSTSTSTSARPATTSRKKDRRTPSPAPTTRTTKTAPAPPPSTSEPTVDGGKSRTEDKVRDALRANPGSTPAEVALAAGVARSTASRILAGWERDGSATRTPGTGAVNGRRPPDRWTATDHTTQDNPASSATADPDGARARPTPIGATAAQAAAGPVRTDRTGRTVTMSGDPRLGKNALRDLVAGHLAAHPDQEFSPTQISRVLAGRSAGAIYNALVKLVAAGEAIETCPAPRRYATAHSGGTHGTAPATPVESAATTAGKPTGVTEPAATSTDSRSRQATKPATRRTKA